MTRVTSPMPWLRRVQWPRGLRAAVAVGIAVLVSHSLGFPPAAAALGAFNPLLVDNGGPYRPRLTVMLTTIFGGAIAYMAGALLPASLWIVVPVTAVVAFTVTFARVVSQPVASSSVLVLVLYFAGLGGIVHSVHGLVIADCIIVMGGIWAVVLSLLLWPLDPFRPARLAVAGCYLWMAQFTARLILSDDPSEVENADPGFEWRRQQRIRIEAARTALSSTSARAPSRTIRARNLTVLLETSDMLLARTMRLAELRATAVRLHLADSSALATDITQWLAGAEQAIANGLPQKPADAGAAFTREGSLRLQFVTRRQQQLTARQPTDHDGLYTHLLREERDALLEIEVAFDAVRALWIGVETPATNFGVKLNNDRTPGWIEALRANWTLKSAALRHAMRMLVVGVVDVIVMRLIHVNHGFWLPMTSIILLQPFSAGSVRKSYQRVTGTVAGGIFAAILAATISDPTLMLVIITLLSALTVATFAVDYAVYCLFLTPTFVLLSLPHAHDWRYAFIRIGTTLAGAAIAIVAMRTLWPERAEAELSHLLRRGAEAASAYLDAMLSFWQFDPEVRQVGERQFLAPARRACGLASNDAEEAVDRVMQEPSFGHQADAGIILRNESLTFVTYLRRLTQSITTLALVGANTPEARARLQPIAERLKHLANGVPLAVLPAELEEPSDATRIDVAEEQMQRMQRQTGVLERAAAKLWQAGVHTPS
jgi:uncharacterized membrane protein YccC